MFTRVVVLVLFTLLCSTLSEANVKNDSKDVDGIGAFVNIIDKLLTRASSHNLRPKDHFCKTSLLKYSGNELRISGQPRGSCSYCCPIVHPQKYVKLYFTNKYLKTRMVELKLNKNPGALQAAGVNNATPTVIFFHGFTEHGLGPLPLQVRDAYLSRPEERNIIIVDWGELSPVPWYPHAAQNTRVVAKVLADFIAYYSGSGELSLELLHLVGFSLGAHAAGFIGKYLSNANMKVPRITGLDPAGPLFSVQDGSQRLSKDDAEYVDVIHTDGGKFGMATSIGHADFYPNGGTYMQPGCTSSYLAENRTFEHFGACSHLRCLDLYTESVWNAEAFPASKCHRRCKKSPSTYMGFSANKGNAVGNFYLETNEQSPFGKLAV